MEFQILGPLVVRSDAGDVPLAGPRQRALLALLLLHANQPVTVERLAAELADGDASEGAIKTVRVNVSRLRKLLGDPGVLTTTVGGYRLRVLPGELDADRFEQLIAAGLAAAQPTRAAAVLREALALWRGPPLGGVDLPFAAAEAARLEEARLGALEARLDADIALGEHVEIRGELRRLCAAYPQRERLHELLMLALYRDGRQADALDAYHSARQTLIADLGLEPGQGLRELQLAILRQDPRLDRAATPEPVPQPVRAYVGREPELAALTAAFGDAVAGRGQLFLVAGEPGIGKSRLAEELGVRATAAGAALIVGRCWEAGGAPAYWPWVQSLRAYLGTVGDDALRAQLGAGAGELAQILPELRRRFPGLPEPLDLDSPAARFRLFEATAELLRSASAARPILLVIDDLHAADAPSLLLLRFLARSLATSRILVLCAYRDVDPVPGSILVETLADLSREPVTQRIELARLTETDVAEYLAATAAELATPELTAALHAETDGNPLFVSETVRLLVAEGVPANLKIAVPQTVRDVVQRRIAHLSAPCGALLATASVLGREFAADTLVRLAEAPEHALDVLDEALAARVITDVPDSDGRLRFAHMVIRDTLYHGLTSVRRIQLHRRALEALGPDAPLSEQAHHALAGHDFARGVDLARRAGDRARTLHAYEEAARLYRAALEVLRDDAVLRCELLLSLGEAEIRAGDTPTAKQVFLDAAVIARRLEHPHRLARAAFGYGGRNVWARAAGDPHLVGLLDEALTALGDDDPELRVMLLGRLAGALRDEPSRERRDRLSLQAVELARRSGSLRALAYALAARTAATLAPDTLAECLARGREMEEIAIRCGDPEQLAAAYTAQMVPQAMSGDIDDLERCAADALRVATELKQPARTWVVLGDRVGIDLLLGRLEGLEERIEEAFAVGGRATPELAIPAYHMQRFSLCELRGDLPAVEPELQWLAAAYPVRLAPRAALAYIQARTGRLDQARSALRELTRDDCSALPFDVLWLYTMGLLAETCALVGDTDVAATLYRLLQPWDHLVAAEIMESLRGAMARYTGLLAWTLGRLGDAEAHFTAAEAMNERMGARPWLAYTREDHARLLHLRGEHERARVLYREAHAAYRELGMTSLGVTCQRGVRT